MPQMSPMSWSIVFSCLFLSFLTLHCLTESSKTKYKLINTKTMNIKKWIW